MRRSWRATACALVAGVLVAVPAASSTAAREAWLPEIADSAELAGSPVVAGELVTKDGKPFPSGARVELLASPNSDVREKTAVGQSLQTPPVAKARVTEGGRFALRVADVATVKRYAAKSGMVDFVVRAVSGDTIALYSLSKHVVTVDGAVALIAAEADATSPRSIKRALAREAAASSSVRITALGTSPAARRLSGDSAPAVTNKTDICGQTKVQTYAPVNVIVGATYLTTTGSTRFTYTTGASSSLGVGFSITGAYGSWSLNGTSSKSSSSTIDFGARTSGSWIDRTQFGYAKWAFWCYPVWDTYDPSDIYAYEAMVDTYHGGGTYVSTTAFSSSNCAPLSPGVTWTVNSSSASGWSTGVSMSGNLGINLSSQTGYTTSASLSYKNTGSVTHQVCGSSGPPASPGKLLLKP